MLLLVGDLELSFRRFIFIIFSTDNTETIALAHFKSFKRYSQKILSNTKVHRLNFIGSWILNNGKVLYTGNWQQGHMHGAGNRYFQVNLFYTSKIRFKSNVEGLFIFCNIYQLILKDGRNYSGTFEYDSMKGNGTMKYPNGTIYRGYFHYGVMVGNAGKYLYNNIQK